MTYDWIAIVGALGIGIIVGLIIATAGMRKGPPEGPPRRDR